MQGYKPRYYQAEAVRAASQYLKDGGSAGLAVLPTGTGKSHIIADLVQTYFRHNNTIRILMVTHVKELIEQNFEKLKMHWETPPGRPPAGINSAGLNSRAFTQPIIYAGIQSVFRSAKKFGTINLLLIDECHLLSDKSEGMYQQFIHGLKEINPALRIVGLTATPFRMDMGHLCEGKTFDKIFYDISGGADFTKLISEGYLSDLKGIQPHDTLDLSKVQKTKNDFAEWSLDEHINRAEITKKIVSETMGRIMGRKKGLAFCVSKSHAEDMSARFGEAGLASTFIHSDLSANDRAERLLKFKKGDVSLIANVGVLTTGFDAPDLDFIVMARPTRSPSLHIQMLGRGMRPHAKKENCLVLDYGGNISRLGFVNDVSIPEAALANEPFLRPKKCESCDAIIAATSEKCRFCGAIVGTSSAKDIVPLEEIYVGDVIKKSSKKTYQTVVELKYVDEKTAIFYYSGGRKRRQYRRFFYTFGANLDNEKISETILRSGTLPKPYSFYFGLNGYEVIGSGDKKWDVIWPKLMSLTGDQLLYLLAEYKKYRETIRQENLEILKNRREYSDKFLTRVFTYPQTQCPLNKERSCLFTVAPQSKKWICLSCEVVTDKKTIMKGFKNLLPEEPLMEKVDFFRTKLLTLGW